MGGAVQEGCTKEATEMASESSAKATAVPAFVANAASLVSPFAQSAKTATRAGGFSPRAVSVPKASKRLLAAGRLCP